MKIFFGMKTVLDQVYAEIQTLHGSRTDELIKNKIWYLVNTYNGLSSSAFQPLDYTDPVTRFVYLFKYVAAHADYVYQILLQLREMVGGPVFFGNNVHISCIGCGPGSDLIGVVKYLTQSEDEPQSGIAYLLDKEIAWAQAWAKIDAQFQSGTKLGVTARHLNALDLTTWNTNSDFLNVDLLTMSFFVSEVMGLDTEGALDQFWIDVLGGAKIGSYLIYHDNNDTRLTDYFDERWSKCGWKSIWKFCGAVTPEAGEKRSELEFYEQKFGHSVKLKTNSVVRILVKHE